MIQAPEEYLGSYQTSMIECFLRKYTKTESLLKPLTFLAQALHHRYLTES